MDFDAKHDNQFSFLAKLLDLSNEAIFAWELHGPIIYWNKGAEIMYGYSRQESVGSISHSLLKTKHPVGLDEVLSTLEKHSSWEGEIIHTTKDGRELIIETRQQVITDDSGKPIVLETNRDITERKKAEKEALENNANLASAMESISDAFFSIDKDWRFTYINRRAANNFGFEPEDLLNQDLWEMFPVIKGTFMETHYRNAMENKMTVHFETRRITNSNYIKCSIYPTKDGISVFWLDVTERKLSELRLTEATNKLEKQSQQLNTILENMSEGVLIIDNNHNIIHVNSPGMRMHGFHSGNHEEFKNFLSIYEAYTLEGKPAESHELPIERVSRGETFSGYTLVLRRKDTGAEWIGSYTGIPIFDDNGELSIAIITLRDVTEHTRHMELLYKADAEQEKREILEQAIAAKDEFLSLVSHELKTPITVINSAIQVMEIVCGSELSPKSEDYLRKIRQNSFRQLRLVNNILELTRITGGYYKTRRQNLDLVFLTGAIIESVIIYAQQRNIAISFICSANQRFAYVDDEKYERILLNLLSNAIKFTPEGKSITVSLRFYKKSMSLIVKDEGIGIPEDKLQYIFEKFGQVDSTLTRKTEGTGIGLSLVKLLTESFGGRIKVKSKVGMGSCFIVKLPIIEPQEEPTEDAEAESQDTINSRVHQITEIELSGIYL